MTTDSDERTETWKPVAPMDVHVQRLEASDKSRGRSIDHMSGNRQLREKVLATRRHDDGYRLITFRCDFPTGAQARSHVHVHKVVLYTFAGEPEAGQEACHSERGPASTGAEGVRWDTKAENHADMAAASTSVVPSSFPCRNHVRCGGTVKNERRRCLKCVTEVGRDAAALLNAGMSLAYVAKRFGYTSTDWVFSWPPSTGMRAPKRRPLRSALSFHSA